MRRARSRRIQAQRKFAQGAYVPPNAVNVVAAENRRDAAQDARNVTINNMTATSLLDVVSLQSVHSHLTSQPVVLIERLRGRNLEGDVPPPSQPETSPPQQPKSIKKTAEQPKLQVGRNKKDCKRVHAMSLRSRRLSKLEWTKLLAQSCVPLRKTPSKRKKASSDEDEPLIFQKTRKKSPAVAAIDDSPWEKSLKVKSSKDIDVPRKVKTKENKTNPVSSKHSKENGKDTKKKKFAPQKTIPKECSPKKPAVTTNKERLTSARDELANETALDNLVTRNDLAMANLAVVSKDPVPAVPVKPKVVPVKSKAVPVKPKIIPVKPKVIPDKPKVISDKPKVTPDKPKVIPDKPKVISDKPKVTPDKPKVIPDKPKVTPVKRKVVPQEPVVVPVKPVVVSDAPVVVSGAPVVVSNTPVVIPGAPVAVTDAPVVFRDVVPDAPVVVPNAMVTVPCHLVSFAPYSEIESQSAEQEAAYLVRMDAALVALDDLPDLDNIMDDHDESTEREEHEEAPLNQRDISEQDRPTVDDEELLDQTDIADEDRSNGFLDSALVYGSDTSDDEPMMRGEAVVQQVHRHTNDSPAPGPSGMQHQFSKNNSDTDEDSDEEESSNNLKLLLNKILATGPSGIQSILREINSDTEEDSDRGRNNKLKTIVKKMLGNANVNLKIGELTKTLPKTCVAASWRTEQDVINASKEQLDSRCMVCKPCHTYEKIFRSNRSDLDSSIEASENELNRQNGEAESGEMGNEERTVAADTDDGYLGFEVSSGNLSQEVRTPVINAQAILGVNCEKNGESLKNKQYLSQVQGKKHELGKLRSTQKCNKNANSDSATAKQAGIREETDTQHIQQKEGDDGPPKKSLEVEISHITQRFEQLQKEKEKEIARLKIEIRSTVRAEMEADRRMIEEVDRMAQTLDKEADAKSMHPKQFPDPDEPGTSGSTTDETLVDAPVYFPTREDFKDPVSFFEKIYPEAMKYGVCKVVPPPGWMPPSEIHGDIRFDIMNQYISRLFSRWGPAARELSAIKLCLHQYTNINFSRPPQLDGVEINLPKLYHLVQRLGGLETVINKNRWSKVADDLKITKAGNYEKRLDNIYMKFLLAYDTLSHQERQEIMRKVEVSWNKKNQKLLDRAMHPLYRQQRMLGLLDSSDEETEDENIKTALKQAEDCIIKGHLMQHSRFKKVASMAYENTFGPGSETAAPPSLEQIEEMYWRLVTSGTEHVCVHTAAIDTGSAGHGFTTTEEPYASHPWNPKQVINNPRNVLRYLGPVVGVTLPTLLLGMLFSTSCWHKDPHGVAWYEYQSKGPARIWYGIPADQADNFRKAVETLSPTSCQNKALWLSSEIAMIPPSALREHNVRLTRVTQNEGEFIMAFPNAYTSCISTGYTESESVYLASWHWIEYMWTAFKEARDSCEPTMFSIEQLLYNIGRDKDADKDLLKRALPLYDLVLREEVTNRQMLQERGISFVQQLLSAQGDQQSSTNSARPLEECDYCRASLFLSKVKGLLGRNSVMCLEHTLALLESDKLKDADVRQLQLLVLVSVKELHKVHDDMRRRLRTKS